MCFFKKHVLFLFFRGLWLFGRLHRRPCPSHAAGSASAIYVRKSISQNTFFAYGFGGRWHASNLRKMRLRFAKSFAQYNPEDSKRAATLIFNMAFVLAFVNYGPHALNVGPLRRLSAHTARKNFFNDILYHICKLPCKGHSGIKNAVTALAFTSVFDVVSLWSRRCMP